MIHQVYISSYYKDAEWLRHALFSLKKFQRGFLHPVVGVARDDLAYIRDIADGAYPETTVVARGAQSWMGAQIRMMEADILCPEADVIHFLGSDCIAYREFIPDPYCKDGKPAVLFNSYAHLAKYGSRVQPWRAGVDRILGFSPDNEYMRRIPSTFPRSIFAPMRELVEKRHGRAFDKYIQEADNAHRNTSEANLLGAFAHKYMPETCSWVDLDKVPWVGTEIVGWPGSILQMWSHGGLDKPMDAAITLSDGSSTMGRKPREVIDTVLYRT